MFENVNGTIISNNVCNNNTDHGIYTYKGEYNTIIKNNCSGNVNGLFLYCNFTQISENILGDQTGNALILRECVNITLTLNEIYNSRGIELEDCINSSVTFNHLEDCVIQGISMANSLRIEVRENLIIDSPGTEINLARTNFTTIESNNCTGIRLNLNSFGNLITRNWATIAIEGNANNNSISYNNCSFSGVNGIDIRNSDHNKIWGNNCSYSTNNWGIYLDSNTNYNEIYGNFLIENWDGCIKDEGSNNNIHDNFCRLSAPTITTTSQTIDTDRLLIQWTSVNSANNYSVSVDGVFNVSSTDTEEQVIFGGNGTYVITVKAIGQYGESFESTSITITVEIPPTNPPDPPVITTSSQTITTDRLLIQWSTVSNVDYYNVYVDAIFNVSSTDTEETVIFWGDGTYIITITAVNTSGESIESNPITITVEIPPTTPPEQPVITTPSQTITTDRLLIQWSIVAETDNYTVYRNGAYYGTTTTNQIEVIFPGDGIYNITVTATNVVGDSEHSDPVEITVDTTTEPPPSGEIPGFELISLLSLIFVSVIVSSILIHRKKKLI